MYKPFLWTNGRRAFLWTTGNRQGRQQTGQQTGQQTSNRQGNRQGSLPLLSPWWDAGIFWSCCALDPFHSKHISMSASFGCVVHAISSRDVLGPQTVAVAPCLAVFALAQAANWKKSGFGVCVHSAAPSMKLLALRHKMACRLSWEDFNQTNLDDLVVRVFASFEVSRLFVFLFYTIVIFFRATTKRHKKR